MEWVTGKVTEGRPTEAFTDTLVGVSLRVLEKSGTPVLDLEFEKVGTLGIFGLDKVSEGGEIEGYTDLGKFMGSLVAKGYALEFGMDGTLVQDARITPDLTGKTVSMAPTVRVVGEKSYTSWTVKAIETSVPRKGRTAAPTSSQPPGDSEALTGEWKVLLAENLDGGVTYDEGGVVKLLGTWITDKTRKAALNKARGPAFKTMFAEGFLKGTLSGFTLG